MVLLLPLLGPSYPRLGLEFALKQWDIGDHVWLCLIS